MKLRRMVKRMTPEEYAAYDNQLKILLQEGHNEQLPRNCIPESYLPHQGVAKLDRETTKLRIVHDATAKSEGGFSPNDVLEKDQISYRYCGEYFSASVLARSVSWVILRKLFCS